MDISRWHNDLEERMSKLVIVESPAKAKTIKKHLGKDYKVMASNGHVRDLPKSKLGVDVDNNFEPEYTTIRGKGTIVKNLKKEAKGSDAVYLATDPDREGEAISWHLAQILDLDLEDANRVTFNEITKSGIQSGMDNPRTVDIDLVNSQQARRILDRLVGYKLSPFLWKKVRYGLSAGRVQSVAVKLIVDREREIRAFESKEYWSIDGFFLGEGSKNVIESKLATKNGSRVDIDNEEQAQAILSEVKDEEFVVSELKKTVRKRKPAPPFITSTLQQEASRKLGFQARRTMRAAQDLYEGVDVEGVGSVGLITYMRTDSLRISDEAITEVREYIGTSFGDKYLPKAPRVYKSKKGSQDGHEAIRPTMASLTPEKVRGSLDNDQYKLYCLIWERFVACQMTDTLLDSVSARISVGDYVFNASGFTIKFDGFARVYEETKDEDDKSDDGIAGGLPPMKEGDKLKVKELRPNQHFTQPPARFTEASLIKTMEENGIGRPSTYAPTISTILNRRYVEREGRSFQPTILGEAINELLEEQFEKIVDPSFTAKMEDDLDKIEEGHSDWIKILDEFYGDFADTLEQAEKNMEGKRITLPVIETDIVCKECGKLMVIKEGRYGPFLACPGFPECRHTEKIIKETGGICPICGKRVIEKKSKRGRTFYGCEGYPDCTFVTWDKPITDKCPQCDNTLYHKTGKDAKIHCLNEGCGYERQVDTDGQSE